jgi:hypothetical protein
VGYGSPTPVPSSFWALVKGRAPGRGENDAQPTAGRLWVDIIEFGRHHSIGVVSLFWQHLRLPGTNPADWTKDPLTVSNGQLPGGVTG